MGHSSNKIDRKRSLQPLFPIFSQDTGPEELEEEESAQQSAPSCLLLLRRDEESPGRWIFWNRRARLKACGRTRTMLQAIVDKNAPKQRAAEDAAVAAEAQVAEHFHRIGLELHKESLDTCTCPSLWRSPPLLFHFSPLPFTFFPFSFMVVNFFRHSLRTSSTLLLKLIIL